jgi:hypothetical protein
MEVGLDMGKKVLSGQDKMHCDFLMRQTFHFLDTGESRQVTMFRAYFTGDSG